MLLSLIHRYTVKNPHVCFCYSCHFFLKAMNHGFESSFFFLKSGISCNLVISVDLPRGCTMWKLFLETISLIWMHWVSLLQRWRLIYMHKLRFLKWQEGCVYPSQNLCFSTLELLDILTSSQATTTPSSCSGWGNLGVAVQKTYFSKHSWNITHVVHRSSSVLTLLLKGRPSTWLSVGKNIGSTMLPEGSVVEKYARQSSGKILHRGPDGNSTTVVEFL